MAARSDEEVRRPRLVSFNENELSEEQEDSPKAMFCSAVLGRVARGYDGGQIVEE
jgi:hypothetical protein